MLVIGALYMLWLAFRTLKSSSVIEETHSESSFLSGAFLQFVNPKIYIYCIVSMEAYILPYCEGEWPLLLFFALLLALIGFVFTLCWSLFGSVFRLLFPDMQRLQILSWPDCSYSARSLCSGRHRPVRMQDFLIRKKQQNRTSEDLGQKRRRGTPEQVCFFLSAKIMEGNQFPS